MRTITTRWHAAKGTPATGWSGPRAIGVAGASGGAGASTLCALIAGALAELIGAGDRRIGLLDASGGTDSPWSDWVSPDLDPGLGQEGLQALDDVRAPRSGYPRASLLRCAGAARGLDGVAVLTRGEGGGPPPQVDSFTSAFSVSVLDLPQRPTPDLAARHRDASGGLVLAVGGTADGIAAGIRSVRTWAAMGLPPSRIRPVVISSGAGSLPPRARARLALLDSNTAPITVVPFDPAIARRGLAEALAGAAIGAPTRIAIGRLLSSFASPAATPATGGGRDALALFGVSATPVVPAPRPVVTAHEGNAR